MDQIDLKRSMKPWLEGHPEETFGRDAPSYKPHDQDRDESRRLEEQITVLALELGASCSRSMEERLDSKRNLLFEAYKKAFVFDDLTLHDVLFRNIEYVFGAGGGVLLLKSAKELLLQWLKNKSTRQVKVRKGDLYLCIQGEGDLDEVYQLLQKLETTPKSLQKTSRVRAVKALPRKPAATPNPDSTGSSPKKRKS